MPCSGQLSSQQWLAKAHTPKFQTHTHTHYCHSVEGGEWLSGPSACSVIPYCSSALFVLVRVDVSDGWTLCLGHFCFSFFWRRTWRCCTFRRRIWGCLVSDTNPAGLMAAGSPPSHTVHTRFASRLPGSLTPLVAAAACALCSHFQA